METEADVNEVIINGVSYIPKSAMEAKELNTDNYVIVRTYSAGVFAGTLVKKDGQEVIMQNVRRIWYWDGAASLSQLAMEGTSKPENCKFPCEVTEITLMQVIEIIPCTKKAMKSIREVKIWEM